MSYKTPLTKNYETCTQHDIEQLEGLLAQEVLKSPSLYTEGRDIQPIEVIEDWQLPHHLGCALKHIALAGREPNEMEHLLKAVWYLKRRIDLMSL